MDFRQGSVGQQTTTEVLYMKRLLFLKAALDNESTVNTVALPLEEDAAFEHPPMSSKSHTARYKTNAARSKRLNSATSKNLHRGDVTTADASEPTLAITSGMDERT